MLIVPSLLTYAFTLLRLRASNGGWRTAALGAAVVWGVYLTILTEFLSAFQLVTQNYLALGWTLAAVVSLVVWLRAPRARTIFTELQTSSLKLPDRTTASLVLGTAVLLGIVGLTGFVAPPNTWDVMDYHLPRVIEWTTYRSVQFFPTLDYAQVLFSPWAEYGLLHVYLLSGGDRLVNFVEWSSYLGLILGVSLIARQFGASPWGQILAAVFCATLPGLVLEASGSMNTAVLAFWLVTSTYFLISFVRQPSAFAAFAAAAAAGLALLTKGTAYFFLPPIVLACWWLGSGRSRKLLLAASPVLIAIGLGLNAPQYIRNFELTHQPLGLPYAPAESQLAFANDRVTVTGTVSSVLRNAALELVTPSARLNDFTQRTVSSIIRTIGGDPNDPGNTWPDTTWWKGFQIPNDVRHEAFASNAIQFVFVLIVGVVVALDRGRRFPNAPTFMLGLIGAFILYSALSRWQVWGGRYFLALLALGGAILGTVVGRMPRAAGATLSAILLVVGLGTAVQNELRPLIQLSGPNIFQQSREAQYFADQHQQYADSWAAAARVVKASSCSRVALDSSGDFMFYPMMALLNDDGRDREIRFGGIENATARYADSTTSCAVVCLYCANVPEKVRAYERPGWTSTQVGDVLVSVMAD